ncbi:MAG: hypothetical protein HUK06_03895 [Bacteroidaceae bacterium]|nr:hypothetical protein [Bacteroidaceae bacterium]
MYRKILLLIALILQFTTTVYAQPSAVKNVQKAVFAFISYDKNGNEIGSGNGVFVSNDGEAVAPCKPFFGAYRVEVTDHAGKKYEVKRMLGANEVHNLAHFKIEAKTTAATVVGAAALQQGTKLYCVGTKQNGNIKQGAVKSVETFMDKYSYYIIKLVGQEGLGGCPFVTEQGQVAGLLEISPNTADAYSTDIRYALTLMPQVLSATDPALAKINVPQQLPSALEDARVMAMMITTRDSLKYAAAATDFMEAFPAEMDGYTMAANVATNAGDCEAADDIMKKAMKNVTDKAEVNYEFSKLIYNKLTYQPEPAYAPWTYDKAIEYIRAAEEISNLSLYRNYEVQILFVQQKYAEADQILITLLAEKDVNKPQIYYESARCKQAMGVANEELVALLDSAINNVDSLSINSAAPYFLMRGQLKDEMKNYREAVLDYSRYQLVSQNKVDDAFFYTRFKAEVNARLYQQAIVDIQNCIIVNPQEPLYPAEKAQLELRVGMIDEAIVSANYCVKIAPDNHTGYTLLAIAQARKGEKEAAMKNFEKAKELGETRTEEYVKKYVGN